MSPLPHRLPRRPAKGIFPVGRLLPREADPLENAVHARYRSVLALLPEGSSFYLPADRLAWYAAHKVAHPAVGARAHFSEQILPLVREVPTALIEFARSLSWAEASELAEQPLWRSPVGLLRPETWAAAMLSLATGKHGC